MKKVATKGEVNLQKLKEETSLLQQLANATKTYYGCGGHHKAAMNETIIGVMKWQLIDEGVRIPSDDELLSFGVFNGIGSF